MRVLAVNDVSCIGKCSIAATLPIISACGVECNLLPTALLSTHTGGFQGYTFLDLTQEIPAVLTHWKSLNIKFEYVYSGYLGSIEQIRLVLRLKQEFLAENGKLIVDPVMGDNGKLYAGFTPEYVAEMRKLCQAADYILPNVTEACYLTDMPYPLTEENAKTAFQKLAELCPRPILTGVSDGNKISVYYGDKGNARVHTNENVEGFFCGAGDVFASAFVGCLARKVEEKDAVALAANFVTSAIRRSAKEVSDKRFGLAFEREIYPFLQNLERVLRKKNSHANG